MEHAFASGGACRHIATQAAAPHQHLIKSCSPVTAGINGSLQGGGLVLASGGHSTRLAGEACRGRRPTKPSGGGTAASQERNEKEAHHSLCCWAAQQRPGGSRGPHGVAEQG